MLSDGSRTRASRKVEEFTAVYRTAKQSGYDVTALALPIFDSQEDFDLCRPEDKGSDFQDRNEFITEVLKGLVTNGVPAEPVLFHFSGFAKWLNGRPITNDTRASYGCHVLVEEARKKKKEVNATVRVR